MTFLTPLLTAGAALIAIPIALHLIMRRRPQPVVFPALRFVRNRRSQNQTRLRLRHLILLALRCAAIALLAFALARPLLTGDAGPGGAGSAGSVAVVVDNSLRMNYRTGNLTRLEAAKERADWLLGQLPADRQVLVADLASRTAGRMLDRDGARARLSRIRPATRTAPLGETVRSAVAALAESASQRQDVYLFSDGTTGGLDDRTLDALAQTLAAYPNARLHLADVGAPSPTNLGIRELRLSSESLAVGQPLRMDATLSVTGAKPAKPVSVELWIDRQGKPEKRAEQLVDAAPGLQSVEFTLATLPEGVHQGYVRVLGGDPLPEDDKRYFTVSVEPARRVLVVAPKRGAAVFIREALAPTSVAEPQVYQVDVATYDDAWQNQLATHQAIMLLDPPPLAARDWRTLANYLSGGGATLLALGRGADLAAFNTEPAQLILPGRLAWKSRDQTYLSPVTYNHPAIQPLAEFAESIPWAAFPVFTYWSLENLDPAAVVVATYANGDPAILERPLERGVALTLTTPLSDSASDDPWNLLPTGVDPWPFVALVDSVSQYLCGSADVRRNYAPGETAVVPLGQADLTGYVLRMPTGDAIRQTLTGAPSEAAIGMTDELGNYRVQAGGETLDTGFSVSVPGATSDLARRPADEIAAALPAERFRLADTRERLAQDIAVGPTGTELYPWLITLVALTLAAENWVSNRFYEGGSEGQPGGGKT